jgi:hypothetical protein
MEHNLSGTINLLEKCRADHAGFVLLSTSRVYSIPPLAALEVEVHERAYRPVFGGQGSEVGGQGATASAPSPAQPISTPGRGTKNQAQGTKNNLPGLSPAGITESFSTASPVSLYGASKFASETLALEYGATFDFPVWINRCGVMAGAGQFGRPDQGIFAYWINAHLRRRPLRYLGFGVMAIRSGTAFIPAISCRCSGSSWPLQRSAKFPAPSIFPEGGLRPVPAATDRLMRRPLRPSRNHRRRAVPPFRSPLGRSPSRPRQPLVELATRHPRRRYPSGNRHPRRSQPPLVGGNRSLKHQAQSPPLIRLPPSGLNFQLFPCDPPFFIPLPT